MSEPNREERWLRTLQVAAFAAFAGFVAWAVLAFGKSGLYDLMLLSGSLQVLGKFVIFWGLNPKFSFGPFTIALYGILFDLGVSLILLTFSRRFESLPGIGKAIATARGKAREVLTTYPRLRRMAFWGVALFVFLPLPGSGAVGGTFAAILLGIPRASSCLAVGLGSAATGCLFAGVALVLREQGENLLKNPWLGLAGLAVFVLFLWFAYRQTAKVLKQE